MQNNSKWRHSGEFVFVHHILGMIGVWQLQNMIHNGSMINCDLGTISQQKYFASATVRWTKTTSLISLTILVYAA